MEWFRIVNHRPIPGLLLPKNYFTSFLHMLLTKINADLLGDTTQLHWPLKHHSRFPFMWLGPTHWPLPSLRDLLKLGAESLPSLSDLLVFLKAVTWNWAKKFNHAEILWGVCEIICKMCDNVCQILWNFQHSPAWTQACRHKTCWNRPTVGWKCPSL